MDLLVPKYQNQSNSHITTILTAKQQAQDTSVLEAKIDKMLYKLYNLITDEVGIVEGGK